MARKISLRNILSALVALAGAGTSTACAEDRATDPAVAQYTAWQEENRLPALMLEASGPAARTPGGNRVGGPVWLAEGEGWPLDRSGNRMTFLAQVDFAELPSLPDYPDSGVLQFFIARDDLFGADFDQPDKGDFKVIWRENMAGAGRFETGSEATPGAYDDYAPLYGEHAARGVALRAQAVRHKPSIDSWLTTRDRDRLPEVSDTAAWDAIYDYENEQTGDGGYGISHIGGHPEYTQSDWRVDEPYQDVDRVLLNLWSMDTDDGVGLMWGDSGQGQFMIRREDLLKKDFSKVFYQWDCY